MEERLKRKRAVIIYLLFLLLFIGMFFWGYRGKNTLTFHKDEGKIFGTFYHITYQHSSSLSKEIEEELQKFDSSLSTFNPHSVISRVNSNDTMVLLDEWFKKVFEKSIEVSKETSGAFDITVAPLVNAWGFGFKKREQVNQAVIDSLLTLVGYQKVRMVGGKVQKDYRDILLDCSAIAKGFACDVVGEMLSKYGVQNFMVEIGGEIFCKGRNEKGEAWHIGINNPIEMGKEGGEVQSINRVLSLSGKGLATSGNYRNFYYEGGKRYAHTLDPHTGYPVQHQLLSATVIAPDCMTADAYATAFMVLGEEKAMEIVEKHSELEAYFISSCENEENFKVSYSKGLEKFLYERGR